MSPETYLKDPCAASSLPYWKTQSVRLPEGLLIVRGDAFSGEPQGYKDEPYFKMLHRMERAERPAVPQGFSLVSIELSALSAHIAACYENERASAEELAAEGAGRLIKDGLAAALVDDETGCIAASGCAQIDPGIGEGILDWIQVTPGYRRRGLGGFIVRELLFRMKPGAAFTVVSGRTGSPSQPQKLYESCGFSETVIWHIMRKTEV